MGYSLVWVAHALLNQTNSKWTWVAHANLGQTSTNGLGMLFSLGCSSCFGSKQYKKNMGCFSVWVAYTNLGQTSTNGHGLLLDMRFLSYKILLRQDDNEHYFVATITTMTTMLKITEKGVIFTKI